VESICWHAPAILTAAPEELPLVKMRSTISGSSNIIFIYSADSPDLFTRVVSTLEQLNLNIVQARIVSMETNGFDLYTLHVLGPDNRIIDDPADQMHVVDVMNRNLRREHFQVRQHRPPRILRNFDVPTRISFRQQADKNLTIMEVSTGDMPGLLSRVGETLDQAGVRVHNARITTLGEQAEDIFYITTRDEEMMITDPALQNALSSALVASLRI
jgi:[protein-PII] uridylyltransferase